MPQSLKRRSVPYPGSGALVVVPEPIWDETLATLRSYAAQQSEGLVFWGGVVSGAALTVLGLYRPSHEPQGHRVELDDVQRRWLLTRLHARDEKLLAQVHSHGGAAFHSAGDDARPASFHEGFFSLVAPHYGLDVERPSQCAVYEISRGAFREVPSRAVAARIHLASLCEERCPRTPHASWVRRLLNQLPGLRNRRNG